MIRLLVLASAALLIVLRLPSLVQPMGADQAGNAAGTIPAWDGGLTKAPPGFVPGRHYVDPFAAAQPGPGATGSCGIFSLDQATRFLRQ